MQSIHNTFTDIPTYCYVKHYTHLHFFEQLINIIRPKNTLIYFTDNISLFIYIKFFKKEEVKLMPIFLSRKSNTSVKHNECTGKILQWESSYMQKPIERVSSKYSRLNDWFKNNMTKNGISFCWSGNNTESHAFGQSAKELSHVTYFGEITNYPHTVYLDRNGTNYFSELVDKIRHSIEEDISISSEEIDKLKNLKKAQKHIPQASLKNKIRIFIALYGIQQFILGSGKRFSIWHVLINKFKSNQTKEHELINNGELNDLKEWMITPSKSEKLLKILVPLQVNHDTQLHVFSNFKSSFDYIRFLLSIIDDQTELHIKLHPAEKKETNRLITHIINSISKKHSNIRLISTYNFQDYDAVATINSTFGIDALLSGCKVITFGQSLYSDFDFILHYGRGGFNNLRESIDAYEDVVRPKSFKYFAKAMQDEFYDFNYFGDNIYQGIPEEVLTKNINRLQSDISTSLLANNKK